MQGKMIQIGIAAFVLAMVVACMFMNAPVDVVTGSTTLSDFYLKTTLCAVMLFLCSAIASYCFFNKVGKKTLHSTTSAVIIGLLGLLFACIVNCIMGKNVTNSIVNMDRAEIDIAGIIKNAILSVIGTLVVGFVTGFGMTIFDFSKRKSNEEAVHTVEQANTGNASVSKTVGAILALLFGWLGVHRYYLGYKKQGAIQTCGFISLVIAYSYYITKFIYGSFATMLGAIFILLLTLYGSVTSVWAFVDFIRILTGGLQPANGNTYTENQPQQVQIVQPIESVSDTVDAIEKLAKLHEQGILNDEEFQRKKAELLAKM